MSARDEVAVAATAAVLVRSRVRGSAVLVGDRYLITAAHVLSRTVDSMGGRLREPAAQVEVVFPAVKGEDGRPGRAQAWCVPPGPGSSAPDAAVLDLGEHLPSWLPRPVPMSPARRLPPAVRVFGFPRGDDLTGVWVRFDTAGQTTAGTVQLDWARQVGTMVGHSGGPVLDPETGMVTGVLIEGSAEGQFDRFTPVAAIVDAWSQLPRSWLTAGGDTAGHFGQQAYARRRPSRGGDLFRGRHQALVAVREWLTAEQGHGHPMVITGQPGAGKSSVAARAAADLQRQGVGPGLAFHAHGATLTDLLTAVVDLTGARSATSIAVLVDGLRQLDGNGEPWMIVIDALDEVSTTTARAELVTLINSLAELSRVRLVVATRPLSPESGQDWYRSGLLYDLGVRGRCDKHLIDLDTDRYFDRGGVVAHAIAVLTRTGAGPLPAGAWAVYRADDDLCQRLAEVIADRAGRNYLVAGLVAEDLAGRIDPVDPWTRGFDPTSLAASVGEAINKHLDSLPIEWGIQVRGMLTALAYARGAGVANDTWLALCAALGFPTGIPQLTRLRRSPAADYLLQTVPAGDGVPVVRLFHQALIDELLHHRAEEGFRRADDECAILDGLRPANGWAWAGEYARGHTAEHAAACGQLAALLYDPGFLGVADLVRLLALLPPQPDRELVPVSVMLRHAAVRAASLSPVRRLRYLALTAAHEGWLDLFRRLAPACGGFAPRWAHGLGSRCQILTGHTGSVQAVAIGRAGDRDVVVSAGDDGTVRIWDATSGRPVGDPLIGHIGPVHAVAIGRAGDRDVVVSAGDDGTVRIWDTITGRSLGEPMVDHPPKLEQLGRSSVRAVAAGRAGDRDIVVFGGWNRPCIRDGISGQPIGEPLTSHIKSVAIGKVGDRDVIVGLSSEYEVAVRIWDAVTGQLLGEPLTGHTERVTAIAIGRAGSRDVIVSASRGGRIRILDATTNLPIGKEIRVNQEMNFFGGPPPTAAAVHLVALGRGGGRDIIVADKHMGAGKDARLQVWDAATGQPVGEPFTDHAGPVTAVTIGRAGNRDIIVTAGIDGTVRIWETSSHAVGQPLIGSPHQIVAIAAGQVAGREIVVSVDPETIALGVGSRLGPKRLGVWDGVSGSPWSGNGTTG